MLASVEWAPGFTPATEEVVLLRGHDGHEIQVYLQDLLAQVATLALKTHPLHHRHVCEYVGATQRVVTAEVVRT